MRLSLASTTLATLLLCAASSEAAPAIKQVLILQSFDRGNLVVDHFTANFRVDLDQRADQPVNVVQVDIGAGGLAAVPEQSVLDYIRSTYANRPAPDLLIAVAAPATIFARTHRRQLFPGTPLLIAATDQRFLLNAPLDDTETAVPSDNDFPRTVDAILQVLPKTRQVFMIMGSGRLGASWHQQLELEFRRFKDRVAFIWYDDLSLAEILRRCANLPPQSAIFYVLFGTDAQGGAYSDGRVLAELHATANAPLFVAPSALFGSGAVGGPLISVEEMARNSADVAIRLLNGVRPGSIRTEPQRPGTPIFDWRELQRWNILESRLPSGSVVRFRSPSLWEAHKLTILTAIAALLIQSVLIAGLLYQRRARRRAELDGRRNLALAADASRRETMSALTSSIGHELGQPLNAMMHNAQALRMMVGAGSASADTIREILQDLEQQSLHASQIIDRHRTMLRSRQMEKKPIDIHTVIAETMELVAHDMRVRRIQSVINLPTHDCIVSGDPVLLQQVLVNLVMNAADAMATLPRRRMTITSEIRAEEVDVSVRDTGSGLPTHVNGMLFTPFVTTKSNGLGIGLTIARTIVEAHGGVIAAHNNPDGGATFTITLRRHEVSAIRSGSPSAA